MIRFVAGMAVGGRGAEDVVGPQEAPAAAGWPDTPPEPTEAQRLERGRREALRELLLGLYLYGYAGRGWNNSIFDAIRALSPEAAAYLDGHGAHETFEVYGRWPEQYPDDAKAVAEREAREP